LLAGLGYGLLITYALVEGSGSKCCCSELDFSEIQQKISSSY